jgi:hypothetical protein
MFELGPRLRHNLRNRTAFNEATVTLACPTCGHGVIFAPKITTVTCERCLTPLLRGPDDDQPLAPTAILPFRVTEAQADARLRAEFAPARDPAYALTWARVYMPYWRFDVHVRCPWRHQSRSYDATIDADRTETMSGEVEDDVRQRFPAAALDDDRGVLDAFEPPSLDEAVSFEPGLLGGTPVQRVTIGLERAWERARSRVEARAEAAVKADAGLWSGLPEEWVANRTTEQAALVLVPLYVGTGRQGASTDLFLLDGYAGTSVQGAPRTSQHSSEAAAANERKNEMPLALGLLVLGALAAVGLLLLWGAVALGRALFAMWR